MDALTSNAEYHAAPPAPRHGATGGTRVLPLPLPWDRLGDRLDIALDRGATYRLVCRTDEQERKIIESLGHCEGVAIVSQDGGLLNHLSLRENLLLPSAYHGDGAAAPLAALEFDAAEFLQACGLATAPEALAGWLRGSPAMLGKLERRLAGFVRALLSRPEILVFENVFEGLTRDEVKRVVHWRRLFQRQFPFRTLMFVDLDFHGLPELDDCRAAIADAVH